MRDMPVFIVNTTTKKVARNFRLDPKIDAELGERSRLTGLPETRIIEDALRHWFGGAMTDEVKDLAARLAQRKSTTLTREASIPTHSVDTHPLTENDNAVIIGGAPVRQSRGLPPSRQRRLRTDAVNSRSG